MNEKDTIAVFKLFLELNGALESYLRQLQGARHQHWTNPFSGEFGGEFGVGIAYLGRAFSWDCSEEGRDYWYDLDKKWMEVLKDVNS